MRGEVQQPGHICAFFTSREEEYDTLIPYLKEGVDTGDQVLNVLDADRLADHRERLDAAGVPFLDGRLQMTSSEDTYLAGGQFEMARMVDFIRDRLVTAASEGKCVRTAGWMDWISRNAPGTERVLEYEARMNLLVADLRLHVRVRVRPVEAVRDDGRRRDGDASVRHPQR